MAEVKGNMNKKTKKTSKVLVDVSSLSNDELLEQIINKKKNKTQKSIAPRKKNTGTSTKKKSTTKKEEVSSDDIYEQIKAKKKTKKNTKQNKESKITSGNEIEQNIKNKELTIGEAYDVVEKKDLIDIKCDGGVKKDSSSLKALSENLKSEDEKRNSNKKEEKSKKVNNEDDWIITREICFDELVNLKDKKTFIAVIKWEITKQSNKKTTWSDLYDRDYYEVVSN